MLRTRGEWGRRRGVFDEQVNDATVNDLIDTHVHLVSDDAARHPRRVDERISNGWWQGGGHDAAALLRSMDLHGVSAALVVQAVGVYGFDNSYLLDAVASDTKRLAAVVAVDLDCRGSGEEILRLGSLGAVVGFRFFAVSPGSSWVTTSAADEAFDAAHTSGCPVVLTVFAHQLTALAPILARYPLLRATLDHCAFPELEGARVRGGSPLLELVDSENVTLKVSSHTLTQVASPYDPSDLVGDLLSHFGPDRLMWGSDWPQTPLENYGDHIALLQSATRHLGPDERTKFVRLNAANWLGERSSLVLPTETTMTCGEKGPNDQD